MSIVSVKGSTQLDPTRRNTQRLVSGTPIPSGVDLLPSINSDTEVQKGVCVTE